MDQPHIVQIAYTDSHTGEGRITRHGIGLLRGITFTLLLLVYVGWTLAVSAQTLFQFSGVVSPLQGALLGLAFLVSLPGLAYLCTARDKSGNFIAPSVMVVLVFLSYGLLAGWLLIMGVAFMLTATTSVGEVFLWVGILAPILSVALSMLLAGIVRTRLVWEPQSKRLKTAKHWLYLSPPSLFLICQVLYIAGLLVG